jgi:hypothetical protein
MKKICVVFEVDEDHLMNDVNGTGVESLSEAISQELGWVADSGIYVASWEHVEEDCNKQQPMGLQETVRAIIEKVKQLFEDDEDVRYIIGENASEMIIDINTTMNITGDFVLCGIVVHGPKYNDYLDIGSNGADAVFDQPRPGTKEYRQGCFEDMDYIYVKTLLKYNGWDDLLNMKR